MATKRKAATGITRILFVLDRSGSMETIRDDTIGGFNAYVQGLQSDGNSYRFTLVQFDTQAVEWQLRDVPIAAVPPLTAESFVPRGGTPLFDAIGQGITGFEPSVSKGDKALVCVLTDGEENSSAEFSLEKVKALIAAKEGLGNWTFVYMSTDIAKWQGAALGFAGGNIATFAATPAGTARNYATLSASTSAYAAGAASASKNFYSPEPETQQQPQ